MTRLRRYTDREASGRFTGENSDPGYRRQAGVIKPGKRTRIKKQKEAKNKEDIHE